MNNKIILYILTFLIDLLLYFIQLFYHLNSVDSLFISLVFVSHFYFYIGLYFNLSLLLTVLHVYIFLFILFSVFLSNVGIKLIVLMLCISIHILWNLKSKCILNDYDEIKEFGYGDIISIHTFIITLVLIYQIVKECYLIYSKGYERRIDSKTSG